MEFQRLRQAAQHGHNHHQQQQQQQQQGALMDDGLYAPGQMPAHSLSQAAGVAGFMLTRLLPMVLTTLLVTIVAHTSTLRDQVTNRRHDAAGPLQPGVPGDARHDGLTAGQSPDAELWAGLGAPLPFESLGVRLPSALRAALLRFDAAVVRFAYSKRNDNLLGMLVQPVMVYHVGTLLQWRGSADGAPHLSPDALLLTSMAVYITGRWVGAGGPGDCFEGQVGW